MIQAEDWAPSSGLVLEPNAERAVKSQTGCIALMAGPGAGKTETLAQRADFLLRTGVCPYPKRILAISFKKDASENLKARVATRCGHQLASRFDSYTFHAFAKRLIDIFRTHLQGQDALDEDYVVDRNHRIPRTQITFDDMVPLANDIVGGCAVAPNAIRETYTDVFLDEFQDCTKHQYSLVVNAFTGAGARIIAVGDTKQKIMGWAGALDGIFVNFGQNFQALPLNLYQNFRSQDRIRRVQNRMVRDIDPPAAVPDSQISGPDGIVAFESFDDDEDEAAWVAEAISEWQSGGVPLSEIAILCNTQPHLYAFKIMASLKKRNIAYRNEQEVQDLFAEPVFELIVDFLVILTGDTEPDAWQRFHQIVGADVIDDDEDTAAREWSQFIMEQTQAVRASREFDAVWQSVELMLQRIGIEGARMMSHDYENAQRFDEILAGVKTHIYACFGPLQSFTVALKAIGRTEAVRILTIHKCKGLEFHSVIVQGVEAETFFGAKDAADCAYFVAISRAKKRLVVTTSSFREKLQGANAYWRESRTAQERYLNYVRPEIGGSAN
jgi:superfamily I DNA/RNA helicase